MEKKLMKMTYGENLASIFGAGFIAFGLGVYFAGYFENYILYIILVGIIMHSWGMYKTHTRNK